MQFFPEYNIFLKIGGFQIHMYAVCIIIGAFIAYLLGQYNFKKLGYSSEILSDYFFGVLMTGIIGARIWYVIFMWKELYASHPEEIIAICRSNKITIADLKEKLNLNKIPKDEYASLVKDLTGQMNLASANLEFERAAELRDLISEIKAKMK